MTAIVQKVFAFASFCFRKVRGIGLELAGWYLYTQLMMMCIVIRDFRKRMAVNKERAKDER